MSYILGALGLLGMWLTGRKSAFGWVVLFAAQCLWVVFAFTEQQYGLLIAAAPGAVIAARSWIEWRRNPPASATA